MELGLGRENWAIPVKLWGFFFFKWKIVFFRWTTVAGLFLVFCYHSYFPGFRPLEQALKNGVYVASPEAVQSSLAVEPLHFSVCISLQWSNLLINDELTKVKKKIKQRWENSLVCFKTSFRHWLQKDFCRTCSLEFNYILITVHR